jgi:hypothetical protein
LEQSVFGKKLLFTKHVIRRLADRGTNQEEVKQALEKGQWIDAKEGRKETKLVFPYGRQWKDVIYERKTVNPVFVVEGDTITVITVYVFYGGKAV